MGLEDLLGAQWVEPESTANQAETHAARETDEAGQQAGETEGSSAPGLGGLLGVLLGGAGQTGADGVPGAPGGRDLGGLLGALLDGGQDAQGVQGAADMGGLLGALVGGSGTNLNGLAEQSGVSQAVIQAAIPLVLGALLRGRQQRAAGLDLATTQPGSATSADLVGRIESGKDIDAQLLQATGLPQELVRQTGLDLSSAISTILNILKTLGIGRRPSGSAGSSGRPKPRSRTARPRPRRAASSKPKPRRRSSAAGAKPKSAHDAAKPKPSGTSSARKPARGSTKPRGSGSSSSRRKTPRG